MKTFIFSYLASVTAIILISLPAVKGAPLDIIPRVGFYFGFPLAIILSVIFLGILHLLENSKKVSGSEYEIAKAEEQQEPLIEKMVA